MRSFQALARCWESGSGMGSRCFACMPNRNPRAHVLFPPPWRMRFWCGIARGGEENDGAERGGIALAWVVAACGGAAPDRSHAPACRVAVRLPRLERCARSLATRGCFHIWRKSLRLRSGWAFVWTRNSWMRWRCVHRAALAISLHFPYLTPRVSSRLLMPARLLPPRRAIWIHRWRRA